MLAAYLIATASVVMGQVPSVTHTASYTNGLQYPGRLAATAGGGIYVTDEPNGTIVEYDAAGLLVNTYPIPELPIGIAVHPNGQIFVSRCDGNIGIYDATFAETGTFDPAPMTMSGPNDMAVDAATGEVYVADTVEMRVLVFDGTLGTLLRSWGMGGSGMGALEAPTTIALDMDLGHVIVGDADNFRIQVFDTSGTFQFKFGYRIAYVGMDQVAWVARTAGIAVDTCNNIYVTDALMGTVRVFDSFGVDLDLANPLLGYGTGAGELRVPCDVMFEDDTLYVVSTNNGAVEVYDAVCTATPAPIYIPTVADTGVAASTRRGETSSPAVPLHYPDNPFDILAAVRSDEYSADLDVDSNGSVNVIDVALAVRNFGVTNLGSNPGGPVPELSSFDPPHVIDIPNKCGRCHAMSGMPGSMVEAAGQANLCQSCHTSGGIAHNMPISEAFAGANHPWGVDAVNAGVVSMGPDPDSVSEMALHLGVGGEMRCGTCHNQHTSNDGAPLLRASNGAGQVCMECHRGPGAQQPHGAEHTKYCTDCHDVHSMGNGNLNLVYETFDTFNFGIVNVTFTDNTIGVGPGAYVDPDVNVRGICEACHEYPSGDPAIFPAHTLDPGMGLCSDCHQHHNGFRPGLDPLPEGQFVGVATCNLCHTATHADWMTTRHEGAWGTLDAIFNGDNPGCLPCHTVGFGEPTGYVDQATTAGLAGVQCENCHGPGSAHTNDVLVVHPTVDKSAALCGGCHTDSHHPTFDEWGTSRHATSSGNAHASSCNACHKPLGDDPVTGEHLNVECVACHDPHVQTGNDAIPIAEHDSQLLFAEIMDPIPAPVSTAALAQDTTRFNLCGQCHHSRGRVWTATSRGPHHSLQVNTFIGEMPVPDATPDIVASVASDHAGLELQCNTCHMYTAPHADGPPEVDAIVGHSWAINYNACAACHDSAEAAEALADGIHAAVHARVDGIKAALGDPATWEYSCCGGPPAGSPGQDDIPDDIKKVRFIVKYIEGDASYGVHNAGYTGAMLDAAEALMGVTPTPTYLGAAACGACHPGDHATWTGTLHASALDNLPVFGQTNPGCLPCHTVAYGQPNGYVDQATTPHLAGVQCENCHGSGAAHVLNPTNVATQPHPDLASEMCGACHTDSHHPTVDEWSLSGHANSAADAHGTSSCFPCHAPLNQAGDVTLFDVECSACHDPHAQTGNDAIPDPAGIRDSQLRFPEYVAPTQSNVITDCTDPARFNACGQCHHSRGRVYTSTSRGPHHSLQGSVLYGEMPMPVGEEGTPLVPNDAMEHSLAEMQCATCHMYKADHQDGPPEVDAITGHLFSMNTQTCNSDPGCHSSVAVAEAALGALQTDVQTGLDDLKVRLGDPVFWEYSCCGGAPGGTPGQDDIPVEILKVRYLIKYIEGDASLGAHNPSYVLSMITEGNSILDAYIGGGGTWPPAAPWWGACCDAVPACIGTMTELDCTAAAGTWHAGEDCGDPDFICP